MKKFVLTLGLLVVIFLLPIQTAYAHDLATDGDIQAVMHIEPYDLPISGTPATYLFTFKDSHGSLRLDDCDCTISIKNEEPMPLIIQSPLVGTMVHTLHSAGTYEIVLSGKSRSKVATFEPFTLTYEIHVGGKSESHFSGLVLIGLSLLISAVVLSALLSERNRKYRK
jgi:hypothetical protein